MNVLPRFFSRRNAKFPARPKRPLRGETLEARVVLTANPAMFWNQVALDAALADSQLEQPQQGGPTWTSRALAIVHAAMFDAYNGVDRLYKPYLVNTLALPKASAAAAVAQAAHDTLAALYPWQAEWLGEMLDESLASVPDGVPEQRGVAYGSQVAQAILGARANDHSSDPSDYHPAGIPGSHAADPLNPNQGYLSPGWGKVTPFAVPSGDHFRSAPFPELTSEEYAAAFHEVWVKGALDAEVSDRDGDGRPDRTDEETEIGLFWGYDHRLGTPPRFYNEAARTIAEQQEATFAESVRLFALVNLAMADAGISSWESKYHYDVWRPIVAIRGADLDGNPATAAEPGWRPLGAPGNFGDPAPFAGKPGPDYDPDPLGGPDFTPPFPAYTSGHATFGAAAFRMIANFFGRDDIPFALYSEDSGTQRRFGSLSQAAEENGVSRIYLGIHWRQDNEAGQEQGRQIADYIFRRALRPLPGTTITASRDGGTLTLLGPATANRLLIIDNGRGRIDIAADAAWRGTYKGIETIVVNTGAGDDRVHYQLQVIGKSTAPGPADLDIDLNIGHDRLILDGRIDTTGGPAVTGPWKIKILAGNGRDDVSINFGDVVFDVHLNVSLGNGNDKARVDLGRVAAGTKFVVGINGNAGNDQIVLAQRGALDGRLVARLNGGAGNDRVTGSFKVHDHSYGVLDAVLFGAEDDDLLTLLARSLSGPDCPLAPRLRTSLWIDGGDGWDTARSDGGVKVLNCES
jgi:hypothetical protein